MHESVTGRPILVMDLHWELLIHEVLDGCGDLVHCNLGTLPPSPGTMLTELEAHGVTPPEARSGSFQTLGSWLLDLTWTEVRIRLNLSKPMVAYNVSYNREYATMCYKLAGHYEEDVYKTCECENPLQAR